MPLRGPVPLPVPQLPTVHRTVPKLDDDSSQKEFGTPDSNPPSWLTTAAYAAALASNSEDTTTAIVRLRMMFLPFEKVA